MELRCSPLHAPHFRYYACRFVFSIFIVYFFTFCFFGFCFFNWCCFCFLYFFFSFDFYLSKQIFETGHGETLTVPAGTSGICPPRGG